MRKAGKTLAEVVDSVEIPADVDDYKGADDSENVESAGISSDVEESVQ